MCITSCTPASAATCPIRFLSQVYNEKVLDTLVSEGGACHFKGTLLAASGITEYLVGDATSAEEVLATAVQRRHTESTRMNAASSRSHFIVRIVSGISMVDTGCSTADMSCRVGAYTSLQPGLHTARVI